MSSTSAACPLDLCFDLDLVLTNGDVSGTTTAAETFVSSLPTAASGGFCSVCMEDFEPERGGKQLPCCHVFHGSCISAWLSRGDSCPVCRYKLFTSYLKEGYSPTTIDEISPAI